MSSTPVRHVSDTARWVAAYRALESARKDAIFHDPLADRLAGERGYAIAKLASEHSRWALVTRTRLIDDLVLNAVADGTRCVVNLAAGFDTRPYRLPLPSDLSWVEADLPELIDEKAELLRNEMPRCTLVRERVDLANDQARAALFDDINGRESRILVITEGLVIYLDPPVVEQLARAVAGVPHFERWIVDFSSAEILQMQKESMGTALENSPFKFAATEGLGFFERQGWVAEHVLSLLREAGRLRRLPVWMRPFALLPQPDPRQPKGRWSVVTQFRKPG